MPAVYGLRLQTESGGLASYGPDVSHLYGRAAGYVAKILKGARPADLPVEQPTKIELVVNARTAAALGISLPRSILLRADDIIR
jgi:putative ABC transport system substrate-binding protein